MLKIALLPALIATILLFSAGPAPAAEAVADEDPASLFAQAGQTAPQDPLTAMALYCRAARLGHAESQLQLGRYYMDGKAVKEDIAAAMLWFDMAARNGNAAARDLRRTLGRSATAEEFGRYRLYNNDRETRLPCAPPRPETDAGTESP
jgi:TPR repeat protein